MSRPRFLADHDFNEHIVDGLLRREPSIEISRVRDHGLASHSDSDILAFAAEQHLLLLSHDVNTMSAAAYERIKSNQPLPGLFMVRQSLPISQVVDDLTAIWAVSEAEEWQGQVWFLPI